MAGAETKTGGAGRAAWGAAMALGKPGMFRGSASGASTWPVMPARHPAVSSLSTINLDEHSLICPLPVRYFCSGNIHWSFLLNPRLLHSTLHAQPRPSYRWRLRYCLVTLVPAVDFWIDEADQAVKIHPRMDLQAETSALGP